MAPRPSAPIADDIELVLANRPYQVVRYLGRGSVGEVWVIRSTTMGREFALKVLHRRHVKNRFLADRFELEARATAALDHHPNVVSVTDYWIANDGRHCLVMQLLRGRTLADELIERKRLHAEEVTDYALQALRALISAHASGIVHRDIKPENLFLHRVLELGVEVKLLDFGLARVASPTTTQRFQPLLATQTGTSIGSPRYASPEALRGDEVDYRSDVYSLGVVMYLSLVGIYNNFDIATRPAFMAPSKQGAIGATEDLDTIILRAVEPRPEDRYQSAREFYDALQGVAPSASKPDFPHVVRRHPQPSGGSNAT